MHNGFNKFLERLRKTVSPCGTTLVVTSCTAMTLTFLVFDAIWCADTTFTPFSTLTLWLTTVLQAGVLMIPLVFFRAWKTQIAVFVAVDLLLLANLWYFRTYSAAIPLKSYLLVGNLDDFTDSVLASVRLVDIVFPALTLTVAVLLARRRSTLRVLSRRTRYIYGSVVTVSLVALTVICQSQGGFVGTIKSMRRNAYMYGSVVPCWSVPGALLYDALTINPEFTEKDRHDIESFLSERPDPCPVTAEARDNIVFILVESFESWVIGAEVEGQVITPRLNALVADSTTLYAPNVLTQVRAGRSIDGQLIYLTGLLPMLSGVHATEYPDNTYPSLPRVLKEKNGAHTYLVTGDKIQTWNQKDLARNVGIDRCFSRPDFSKDEASGLRPRIGDRALVRETIAKMDDRLLWPVGEKAFVQLVTFTTHDPFKISDELKSVSFSPAVPEVMADYMTAVRYTDEAIGNFVDYIRSRPDGDRTMIVIVGDHEGLASHRSDIRRSDIGARTVSPGKFTPFIVLNSPVPGRYDGILGQVDVYPTLLALLGATDYRWQGLGQSILDPSRPDVAIGSHMEVVAGPDFDLADPDNARIVERLKDAHEISDRMIVFDFLEKYYNPK